MKVAPSARGAIVAGLSLAALWWLSPAAAPQSSAAQPICIIVAASEPQARKLRERLDRGEDFNALARSQSIDPSAADGGYLGSLKPEDLRQELRDGLEGVAAGHFSGIVKIPSGYAILK
ncbi:MAG TPA: peptidylprolyl isomerase, partial [Bryobacteraceae bacterium]